MTETQKPDRDEFATAIPQMKRLRVADTNATNAHGNSVILPGDMVEVDSRWCRVLEVSPSSTELKIYKQSAFHSSVETVHAEAVDGYRPREDA